MNSDTDTKSISQFALRDSQIDTNMFLNSSLAKAKDRVMHEIHNYKETPKSKYEKEVQTFITEKLSEERGL